MIMVGIAVLLYKTLLHHTAVVLALIAVLVATVELYLLGKEYIRDRKVVLPDRNEVPIF